MYVDYFMLEAYDKILKTIELLEQDHPKTQDTYQSGVRDGIHLIKTVIQSLKEDEQDLIR